MQVKDPLVSVIIPCFNAAGHLASTLQSVLAQTYRPIEILVVDDHSTDDTYQTALNLTDGTPNLQVISLPENSGTPARPRNVGVQRARGEWVAFLDADDLWHPQKLALQMALLRESGLAMCSTSMVDFVDEAKVEFQPLALTELSELPTTKVYFKSQLVKYLTPTSSIVLRRDVALQYPFPEDRKYRGREDFYCMLSVHEAAEPSLKLLLPLMLYRQHAVQISRNKIDMARKQLMILREYRRRDGSGLGVKVYAYLMGHMLLSLYYRVVRNRL